MTFSLNFLVENAAVYITKKVKFFQIPTPQASLFTDYRDNKPPYLKYSRDDFDVNDQKRHVNGTQVDTTTRSSGESSGSGGSH